MSPVEVIGWGCLGGIIPDVLRILPKRYGDVPTYLLKPFFWVSLIILGAIGGVMTYALAPNGITNALAVGYSAPSILSKLLGIKDAEEVEATRGPLRVETRSLIEEIRTWWSL
jgi:hypothetical protein